MRERALYGTAPISSTRRIGELGGVSALDEIAILTTVHDKQARRRSYELLAREEMARIAGVPAEASAAPRRIAAGSCLNGATGECRGSGQPAGWSRRP